MTTQTKGAKLFLRLLPQLCGKLRRLGLQQCKISYPGHQWQHGIHYRSRVVFG